MSHRICAAADWQGFDGTPIALWQQTCRGNFKQPVLDLALLACAFSGTGVKNFVLGCIKGSSALLVAAFWVEREGHWSLEAQAVAGQSGSKVQPCIALPVRPLPLIAGEDNPIAEKGW
ncbi:hypothetical protein RZS08_52125, partial [Arthrospira platensis SPKY1]|nr:hypothetical protein [Arthrospira platensis SPKY1]